MHLHLFIIFFPVSSATNSFPSPPPPPTDLFIHHCLAQHIHQSRLLYTFTFLFLFFHFLAMFHPLLQASLSFCTFWFLTIWTDVRMKTLFLSFLISYLFLMSFLRVGFCVASYLCCSLDFFYCTIREKNNYPTVSLMISFCYSFTYVPSVFFSRSLFHLSIFHLF